jgi:fibronectin-binding autotransporter adhesin
VNPDFHEQLSHINPQILNVMKPRSNSTILAASLAATLLSTPASQAIDLVTWDIPTSTPTSALTSSVATGLSASAVSLGSGLNISSSSTLWRTRGYNDTTTRSINFSITASAGNTVTVESLLFTANAQAGTGSAWTAPGLRLDYSTDATFTTGVTSAGTLSLGGDLAASTTSSAVAATGSTFLATDLVISAGQTYYFRIVGLGANAGTNNQISYLSSADMQLTGSVVSGAANLVWAGASGAAWNTSQANFTNAGNPATFATNDNVTIQTAGGIAIDAAGVTAGTLTHTTASGTTTLNTGNLTTTSLVKSGAGTLAVVSPVSFSTGLGSSTLSSGVLQILGGASFTTPNLNLSGGASVEIASTATFSCSGANTLSSGGAIFANDAAVTLANISNSILNNPFTKSGSGVLTLTGIGTQNTGPADLDITAGSIIANGPVGSGRQINIGGTNILNGDLTLNGPVLMLHGSTVSGTGSIIANGSTSSITSRLNLGAVSVANAILLNTALNIESPNGNNLLRLNGPITGADGLVKLGNGTVELAGTNSYLGTTTISAGILRIGSGVTGTLGAGDVVLATLGTIQFNREDNITIPNLITGSGNVTVSSLDHTATLNAANTYTGITTITEGRLGAPVLADGGLVSSIGQSTADPANLVFNGGSLSYAGATAASTDRDFTLGINGGGPSAIDAGAIIYASTNAITLAGQVPDTTASVSSSPTITALIVGTRYQIITVGDTDFTLIGAASNTIGSAFTATGAGVGTGTVVSGLTVGTTYRIVTPGTTDFTLLGAADSLANTVFVATASGFNSGTGTIAYANANFRPFRLGGSGTGNNSIAAVIADGPTDPNIFNSNKTSFSKNGTSIWSTSAVNTYTGPTAVNGGILRIDGASPATTGAITVVNGASLGGNGLTGGAVTLNSGGGLAAKISDWTGSAGTGYDDLAVAGLSVSGPMTVVINSTGLANFTESVKSFTILNTSGSITSFNPANVTVTAPGFPGTGTWSLAQAGNSLVLSYALAVADPYLAWATGAPYNLAGANALPTADPDKDGISNSVEFVIGGNPASVSNTALLPTLVVNPTNFVFTYRLSDISGYLNPTVQYGSTLSGWTTAQNGVNGVTIGAPTALETGIKQVVVTIPKTLAVDSRLFARLNVVVP